MKEREVGEIFEFQGKYYKTVESEDNSCKDCVFYHCCDKNIVGLCSAYNRHDGTSVAFVEVNKPIEIITSKPSNKKKLLLIFKL